MAGLSPTERKVVELVNEMGVVRVRDIKDRNLHPEHLRRLVQKGYLVRLSRGVYAPAGFEATEHHGLAQVAIRTPHAVICLLSALLYHDLTTQLPRKVWIAIPPNARVPTLDWPPIEVHRFSGRSFSEGWTEHELEGVPVRIFDPAKTVADCFKFRNTVGLDVAIEALRDCLRQKRATADELIDSARICRVDTVMRPYLEAMV
jgi:predicted transcriptional regulator of viral defense system